MTNEILRLSATELGRRIQAKEVSPVEVTELLMDSSRLVDPYLNAFISFRGEQAMQEARQAEDEIAAGKSRSMLHGVPMAIKDNLGIGGEITTMGSKIHRDYVPQTNSNVFKKLREAGIVLTGKLNMHEYAAGADNQSPHFGPARNPWNLDKVAGGSSGGPGAAVAANLSFASVGTDTGGSIHIPASMCGIVGLKPTHGLVGKSGCFPLAWTLDHVGPMTKTVEDAGNMLEILTGLDPADATSVTSPTTLDFSTIGNGVEGITLGVELDYYMHLVDPLVKKVVEQRLHDLEAAGAQIKVIKLPALEDVPFAFMVTFLSEAAAIHRPAMQEHYDDLGQDLRVMFMLGETFSGVDYVYAQQIRRQLKLEFARQFETVDAIITPTVPTLPPDVGTFTTVIEGEEYPTLDQLGRFNRPTNLTGNPSVSVPAGVVRGLPVGIQVIGPVFEEIKVLQIAKVIEAMNPLGGAGPILNAADLQ